ncbi:MAG: D-alanine--D-alanine ligase [bacterium]|nr:D-alanine--D-alanine ligase [bacterium]
MLLKKNLRVAVLMGGPSSEREISLKSGEAVIKAVKKLGYLPISFDVDDTIAQKLVKEKVEVAFIALHGRFGEDGTVQRILEDLSIPYVGSGVKASVFALNKIRSKDVFALNNILTPSYTQLNSTPMHKFADDCKLNLPWVIKPAREGSTIGISIIKNKDEFANACKLARKYDYDVLIEEYIPGKEITVGIIGAKELIPLPVIEIVPEKGFYDFEAKYTKGLTKFKIPASLSEDIYKEAQKLACKVHQSLGCYGMSRVDMICDHINQIYILEVNTIPGLTELSLLPKAAAYMGMSFEDLVDTLLSYAFDREGYVSKQ